MILQLIITIATGLAIESYFAFVLWSNWQKCLDGSERPPATPRAVPETATPSFNMEWLFDMTFRGFLI